MRLMALFAAVSIGFGASAAIAAVPSETELRSRAEAIHRSAVSLDSHTDAPLEWEAGKGSLADGSNCVNLRKMEQGRLDATYCAAWVPSHVKVRGKRVMAPLNEATYARIWARTNALLDLVEHQVALNSGACGIARDAGDVVRLKEQGRKAVLLSVENALGIGADISRIDSLAARGVSLITLTHVYDNQLCTSSTHSSDRSAGLSPLGRQAVARMNELGIVIDLSHASERTFYDVIDLSSKPVVASHSGVKALCSSDRNLTDDQLRAIARNGGVVQIVAYSGFISRRKKNASLARMVDHIDHAVRIAGIDHVGIGSDFDGGGSLPGFADQSQFIAVTVELLRRGYSDDDIRKILGANFLRVLSQQKQ